MNRIPREELEKLGNFELLAKQVVEGFITGLHKSPFHGFSVEFAEHRTYNTGESTRHIDWKLFARTEKLFVKRFEEETNLRCQLVIDTSSSMYYPDKSWNKMKFSGIAAAAIMNLLRRQRDAFSVAFLSDQIEWQSETRSSSSHYHLLLQQIESRLQTAPVHKVTKLARSLDILAEKIHRRSMVVIFSDLMETIEDTESLFRSLQHLKFNKHEVILFHVQDKEKESDFNFQNRPYLFTDPETGNQLKVMPNEVRESYLQAQADYRKLMRNKAAQFKIDWVEVDAADDFNQVLLAFLIKRAKMS
ncbi:MAG TPA: DUF58 domain-containing protein [Bacteroidetes bacterium]|nr:DUF58 domain-containing protein [Bacteroidota bacterium]